MKQPKHEPQELDKQKLSQSIADALGRGRLVVEQQLELTDSWIAAYEFASAKDFDSIRVLMDGDRKAT